MRTILLMLVPALLADMPAQNRIPIGLTSAGTAIEAIVAAGDGPTVLVIGGMDGTAIQPAPPVRGLRLLTIPLANPTKAQLSFPPAGTAYRENGESHYLWRWIGTSAPDLVVISGADDFGLARALEENAVAGIGRIPVRRTMPKAGEKIPPSAAHQEMERRLARSPREVAEQLAKVYGHELPEAVYIPTMALIGRMRLGERADVDRIVAPFVSGAKNSLAKPTASHFSGHLIFAETGNTALVRRAADMAGGPDPASLYNEMSDGVFMGCPILAQAGRLTGQSKYFDQSLAQLAYMQKLCLRPDGLYRHSPLNDAAWGRGNAFPALGLALALSAIPKNQPAFAPMLRSFQEHMKVLAGFQNEEGMWRQVVDRPGVYAEFSATAMIGIAMRRGVRNGWLDAAAWQPRIDRAWRAILKRTSSDGRLIDVCEGTGKQKSADDYLRRGAILDRDPRGGGMALYFATEMAGLSEAIP
jgi:hypothetical protein